MTAFTRLHIKPFAPDISRAILGSNLTKVAQNISYHTIDTYPENNYGFVDLPSNDAQILTKKLNGAILRGRKMKLEEARTKKRKRTEAESDDGVTKVKVEKHDKKAQKQQKIGNVLDGRELSPDRKVKRGWTEPKEEKRRKTRSKDKTLAKPQQSSKYTDHDELLFRTRVPRNKLDLSTKAAKDKSNSTDVVHEFSRSVKQSSFLRTSGAEAQPANEYIEGTGWVDKDGNVLEQAPKVRHSKKRLHKQLEIDIGKAQSKGSVAISKFDLDNLPPRFTSHGKRSSINEHTVGEDETSSSGTSTVGEESTDSDSTSESSDSEEFHRPETPAKVHPLEALFKKPSLPSVEEIAKPSLEVDVGFSFFGQDVVEDEDDLLDVPATPFTANDIRSRGTRSAAPTPDTAHPSRFASFDSALSSSSAMDRDSSVGPDHEANPRDTATEAKALPTDFEKRFWESRGDNNRSWKARRRAALKDQRQRENKARRPRNW